MNLEKENEAFKEAVEAFCVGNQAHPNQTDKLEGFVSGWIAYQKFVQQEDTHVD